MQDFRNLQVWQKAHEMNLKLYEATAHFPKSEMFGLSSQIRRAGTSITANLAEGRGRGSDADFLRFVFIAMGSACELESHLELAKDLEFLSAADYRQLQNQLIEVKRMLSGLIAKLKDGRTATARRPAQADRMPLAESARLRADGKV